MTAAATIPTATVLELEDDGTVLVVRCPWCGHEHRHGAAAGGHRQAHCGPGRGYVLVRQPPH